MNTGEYIQLYCWQNNFTCSTPYKYMYYQATYFENTQLLAQFTLKEFNNGTHGCRLNFCNGVVKFDVKALLEDYIHHFKATTNKRN